MTVANDVLAYANDQLSHHGVPGMKWGRRKARPVGPGKRSRKDIRSDNKAQKKAFKSANKEFKAASKLSRKENKAADKAWKKSIGKTSSEHMKSLATDKKFQAGVESILQQAASSKKRVSRRTIDYSIARWTAEHSNQVFSKNKNFQNPSGTRALVSSVVENNGSFYVQNTVGSLKLSKPDKIRHSAVDEEDTDDFVEIYEISEDGALVLYTGDTSGFKDIEAEDLSHAGVLGMKWGVRKARNKKSTGKKAKTKRASVKSMSDSDLRSRINRLQMEGQFKSLNRKTKPYNVALRILENAATQTATNYISKAMGAGIDSVTELGAINKVRKKQVV